MPQHEIQPLLGFFVVQSWFDGLLIYLLLTGGGGGNRKRMAAFWKVHAGFYWPNLLSFRTCFSYLRGVDYLLFSVSDLLFENWLRRTMHGFPSQILNNLVPRVLSYPPYRARELETLVGVGHGSPRIWEITNKRFRGEGPESVRFVSTERRQVSDANETV